VPLRGKAEATNGRLTSERQVTLKFQKEGKKRGQAKGKQVSWFERAVISSLSDMGDGRRRRSTESLLLGTPETQKGCLVHGQDGQISEREGLSGGKTQRNRPLRGKSSLPREG